MDCTTVPYIQTSYFSELITDYLSEKETVKPLCHRFPTLAAFAEQIKEKAHYFSAEKRQILYQELLLQNNDTALSEKSKYHIEQLQYDHCFTITTGHQLNLFTGPVYFIYKIISTLKLCQQLQEQYPQQHFVPIYWMATEDHDFEEINHFYWENKKMVWQQEAGGAVGDKATDGLEALLELLKKELGISKNAQWLLELFEKSYLQHTNLAAATRYLVNAIFADYGLVIIDGNSAVLKQFLVPIIDKELKEQTTYQKVLEQIEVMKPHKPQVNPRDINLFYLEKNSRNRITFEEGVYKIVGTSTTFTPSAMAELLQESPEKFSPNVLLRPVYQEIILPNLCYIGGAGELAYWLQLKTTFEAFEVPFPMLLLRNAAIITSQKQLSKWHKMGLTTAQLTLSKAAIRHQIVALHSTNPYPFESITTLLQQHFKDLQDVAQKTDASFVGAVAAQEKKQLKGIAQLEKRWLYAEKRQHADLLQRAELLYTTLQPNGQLQERSVNFSTFYVANGASFIDNLYHVFEPLVPEMSIVSFT